VSLPLPIPKLHLCYVTDQTALRGSALLEKIENAGRAGVDWIQIREKDLSSAALYTLVREAVARVPHTCRILVNDRLDVAIAADAGGVHLGEQSMPLEEARRFLLENKARGDFLVGVSTHSLESARSAEKAGADYALFGPVFETPSKFEFGAPQGIARLAEVCRAVGIPVIAIGGITELNLGACMAAGAAGIAAIRLFQDSPDIGAAVGRLRKR
jgi:thiamine-phosphate pyrophosphorylase